ncbi:MAG: alanine--tRNA ligase [Bacteroidales bacterium]|jgi:alanyl-tRNA synthetase|nr:alanine--tRNA ligase [Bacteroidales bacterium]
MNANEIRKTFLDFFKSKQHQIVPSAPMVIKNDPTLMFTNAGMNQFKDIFLGHAPIKSPRVANSQKCLRVSGKHNDLEEVGHDTYHHTMFEMLGNWSFGDYFKKEAIEWGWELLNKVYGIDADRMYVTVFGGDKADNQEPDQEAYDYWKKIVGEDRILYGSKKDNFWEMGETGPCGPCSEIHVDIRNDEERKKLNGKELVNKDHPQVIEIWNLVFIQYNRNFSGVLEPLTAKHVDTGMGFERLCMILQGKQSNYDTDVFQPLIQAVSQMASYKYSTNEDKDIAVRVISDHIRAISFAIADGQLPSNGGAGYVIRRILRRAIRYGYTFLGFNQAFMYNLIPILVEQMGSHFPELKKQEDLISKVVQEEENAFLKTLAHGIQKFDRYISSNKSGKTIEGDFAFELFDTFGFPIDLTQLIASERGYKVDMEGFEKGLEEQKTRSRQAASIETEDWVNISDIKIEPVFTGYEELETTSKLQKYRKTKVKDKVKYQLIFEKSPFYAEAGGQVGDTGYAINSRTGEKILITDTKSENNLNIHISEKLPKDLNDDFVLKVDVEKRNLTQNNHSATHLLHSALRKVLGTHVEQKGSLVNADRLRFDFSHFSKLTDEEIEQIENMVNEKIRESIDTGEFRGMSMDKAVEMGAIALFGEKYGDNVRVIQFDPEFSTELCGGTHVENTSQIGLFKIVSEGAIAAGVRRIEAISSTSAIEYYKEKELRLKKAEELLKNPRDIIKAIEQLLEENSKNQKQLDTLLREKAMQVSEDLIKNAETINGVSFIAQKLDMQLGTIKDLLFDLKKKNDSVFAIIANAQADKVNLSLIISDELVESKSWDASALIREFAKEINGGGGGQKFFATAGGKNPNGIEKALEKAREFVNTNS